MNVIVKMNNFTFYICDIYLYLSYSIFQPLMIYLDISFCQPNGIMPALVKASHHLSKAFPTCGLSSPMEKILWERSV